MSPPRVLVVGPAWIGDTVIAHSLFQLIRARLGQPLDVLAPAWTLPLLARMPEVAEAIAAPFEHGRLHLLRRLRLARMLKGRGYTRAFILPNSLKSALVPFLARIPRRTGFVGELRYGLINDARRLDESAARLMAQRYVSLLQDPGEPPLAARDIPAPRLKASRNSVNETLDKLALDRHRPALALCPGAEYGPAKQWPAPHFAEVAKHYHERGHTVWVLGSEKDRPVAREVERSCGGGRCRVLAGRTTLAEAIDLLSAAALVVSNDSGLMHIAAALGRPLVAVFGSTDPDCTPPVGEHTRIVRRQDLPCSPCFRRRCPLGHLACLRELPPGDVIDASEKLLAA